MVDAATAYALRRRQAARRWTPALSSALVAWYDFTRPIGRMWQEVARTNLVEEEDDPVGSVVPLGSAAADPDDTAYTQATGGSRPLFPGGHLPLTSTLELNGPASALLPISAPPWTLAGVARYDELPGTNDPLVRMATGVEVRGNTDGSTLTVGAGAAATIGTAAIEGIAVGQWFGFIVVYGERNGSNNVGRLWVNGQWFGSDFEFTTNEAASSRKPTLDASTKSRSWRTLALFDSILPGREMRLLTDHLNALRGRS